MRTNGLTKWIAVLAMVGAGSLASASDYFLTGSGPGQLLVDGDTGYFGQNPAPASINDKWYFQLNSPSDVGAAAWSFKLKPGGAVNSLTLQLFTAANADASGGAFAPDAFPLLTLGSGSYYIHVLGSAIGSAVYGGSVAVSAVPLPAAAWLLLSGLAGVGVMTRRRRRDAGVATV